MKVALCIFRILLKCSDQLEIVMLLLLVNKAIKQKMFFFQKEYQSVYNYTDNGLLYFQTL